MATSEPVEPKLNIEDQLKALEIEEEDEPVHGEQDEVEGGAEVPESFTQDVVGNQEEVEEERKSPDCEADAIQKAVRVENEDGSGPTEGSDGIKFVTYTEEELAHMEVIEYEFEDPNMSLSDLGIFDRSLSLMDLREKDEEDNEASDSNFHRSI